MGRQKQLKLNQLQRILPEGLPVDSNWLQSKGYSRQLIAKYVQNGWLTSPTRGVYLRESALLNSKDWQPVVISLQRLFDLPVTVGGRTALDMQGYAHYLTLAGPQHVHLYAEQPLPGWVIKLPLNQELSFHSTRLFAGSAKSRDHKNKEEQAHFTDVKWGAVDWSLRISTPERAILELLDELPDHESFHQADVLMEGLTNLRPRYLNILLANCRSIKTKRLFLWYAERHNHQWFKSLDTKKVDLGSGKRMLVPGGKLDGKYLITVPRELVNDR